MDRLHHPASRHWIAKQPIQLSEHFSNFAEVVKKAQGRGQHGVARGDLRQSGARATMVMMGLDEASAGVDSASDVEEMFKEIEDVCAISGLEVEGEVAPVAIRTSGEEANDGSDGSVSAISPAGPNARFRSAPIPQEGVRTLQTLELQQMWNERANRYDRHKRLRNLRRGNNWMEATPPPPKKTNPVALEKEFVVTVHVYRSSAKSLSRTVNPNAFKFSQEFLLLGSTPLTDLRDHIKCVADLSVPGDVSEAGNRSGAAPRVARDVYRSGFFYIEGCFYNDMRWPECRDNSRVIREWAENPRRQLGPFTTKKMEETVVGDLTVRLGYPYVYVHQGDHEHLISFVDARLMGVHDDPRRTRYPLERSVATRHSKYCMVCSVDIARWITTGNDRVPEDPFFFCDECFHRFNYDSDGHKLGNFRAHPYVDVNAM